MARTINDYIEYRNQGAIRDKPLSPELAQALSFLPEMGVTMRVFSGGETPEKKASNSGRHLHGNSADVFFFKDGRQLDWANQADIPIYQEIVARGKANGLTGFGAGPGYMQQGSMHVGFGAPAVWGNGNTRKNAPKWLIDAYEGRSGGDYSGDNVNPVQTASVADVYQSPDMPYGAQMMAYAPQAGAQAAPSAADAFVPPDNRALSMASPSPLAMQQAGTVQAPTPAPVVGPAPRASAVADLFPVPEITPTLGPGIVPDVQMAEGMVSPLAPQTASQGIADVFGPSSTPMAATAPQSVAQVFGAEDKPDGAGGPDTKGISIPTLGILGAGAALGIGSALWPGMDAAEAERVRRIGGIGGVTKVPDSVRRLTSG